MRLPNGKALIASLPAAHEGFKKTQDNYIRKPSIAEVKHSALANLPRLLEVLIPNGQVRGNLYFALNPTRPDRSIGSFYVNLDTGYWCDKATDEHGDVIDLVVYLKGGTIADAKDWLASWLGMSALAAPVRTLIHHEPQKSEEQRRDLSPIITQLVAINGTPVEPYLLSRCLSISGLENVYYHPRWAYKDEFDSLTRSPAMVALIHNLDGDIVGIHATMLLHSGMKRLDSNGHKITRYRSVTPGALNGAAIQLNEAGQHLGLGEGLETSLALGILFRIPVWATGDAGKLSVVKLPGCIRRVSIAVDNDAAGKRASSELASRLTAEGRTVVLVHAEKLGLPEKGDLADFLLQVAG